MPLCGKTFARKIWSKLWLYCNFAIGKIKNCEKSATYKFYDYETFSSFYSSSRAYDPCGV